MTEHMQLDNLHLKCIFLNLLTTSWDVRIKWATSNKMNTIKTTVADSVSFAAQVLN
jgi:hypothetical protein